MRNAQNFNDFRSVGTYYRKKIDILEIEAVVVRNGGEKKFKILR